MMHWNMARFAGALLPAINAVDPEGVEEAKTIVDGIPDRFRSAWLARMRGKLGIAGAFDGEGDLIDGLFEALERHGVDFTGFFRAPAALLRGDGDPLAALLPESEAMASWLADWCQRIEAQADATAAPPAWQRVGNPTASPAHSQ